MKLVSLALIVLFGRANSSPVNCIENCKEIRNDMLSEPHTCNPALTIAPSPDVYKSCQTGKKAAFDKACVPLCNGEETTTASLTSSASIACRSNRGRGPSDYWCKRGFSSILKKLEGYSFPAVEEAIIEETVQNSGEAVMSSDEAEVKSKEEESLEEEPEESKDEGLEKEHEDPNEENLEKGLDESKDEGLEVEVDPADEHLEEEPEESQDESHEEEVDEATDAIADQEPAEEIVGEVEYAEANEF